MEIVGVASIKSYNGKQMGCLGLYSFNYVPNVDKTKFPMNAVEVYLDWYTPVPEIEGDGYTFSFQFIVFEDGSKCLQVLVKSDDKFYEMEEEYFYALLGRRYRIAQWDESVGDFTEHIFEQGDTYPEYEDSICYYAYERFGSFFIYVDYDLSNGVLVLEFYTLG